MPSQIGPDIYEFVNDLGLEAKFLVVGMFANRAVRVDVHRVDPLSGSYIDKSTFKMNQENRRVSNHNQVYLGLRLERDRETGIYLFRDPKKEGE